METIVVDNNSRDNSVAMVKNDFPDTIIIKNEINIGYAKAVNQGIKLSRGRYILVLNADVIVKGNAIASLVTYMNNHPKVGIAGPKLLYPDGRLQWSCRTFYNFKIILLRRTFLSRLFPKNKIVSDHMMYTIDHNNELEVDWLLGASLMVRKTAIDQVGLMDERYFLYFEDVDWCNKMKKAGWGVSYVPESEIIHYHRQGSRSEGTFSKDLFVHLLSSMHYFDKWNRNFNKLKHFLSFISTLIYIMIDAMIIVSSFSMAYLIRASVQHYLQKPLYPLSAYYPLIIAFSVVLIAALYMSGMYDRYQRHQRMEIFYVILKSSAFASVAMFLLLLLSQSYSIGYHYSRMVLFGFLAIQLILMTAVYKFRFFIAGYIWEKRFNLKRALIVGDDQAALELKDELSEAPHYGYEIVGLVKTADVPPPDNAAYRFIGRVHSLLDLCKREQINEVFFVNLNKYFEKAIYPIICCKNKLIDVKIITDNMDIMTLDSKFQDFAGFPCLNLTCRPGYYIGLGVKRISDVIISFSALLLLLPLYLLISLVLKIQGPRVHLIEKRVGKKGKIFSMYKFDTFQDPSGDAVSLKGGNPAKQKISSFRKVLRKYNLDEIPQLFNVLKGEMSFIGPRPALPEEVVKDNDLHKARLEAKPGITGLWQIDKTRKWKLDEMVRMDIFYILNRSLLLDLKILLRTPGAILKGTGYLW